MRKKKEIESILEVIEEEKCVDKILSEKGSSNMRGKNVFRVWDDKWIDGWAWDDKWIDGWAWDNR